MAFEQIKKIAINFAAAIIVAMIFSSVAPGTAQKVYGFLEDKLGFGEPSIGSFTVAIDEKDITQFVVKYSILGNYRDVEKVVVSRSYAKVPDASKAADAKMSERFKLGDPLTLEGENVVEILKNSNGIMDGKEKIKTDKKKADGSIYHINVAGVHRFTLEVYLSNGDVDSKDAEISIYDDDYIELFKGGIRGCVTKSSIRKCDVDAEKRFVLEGGVGYANKDTVLKAYSNSEVNNKNPNCKYESSGWFIFSESRLSDECTPEEVNKVWIEYLELKGASDYYDCELPFKLYKTSSFKRVGALEVCMVKRDVVRTLNKLGWFDLREHKGWEAYI